MRNLLAPLLGIVLTAGAWSAAAAPDSDSTAATPAAADAASDSPATPAAPADASQESSYISGLGTYTRPSRKRGPDVHSGVGGQFLYGNQFSSRFGYEVGGFFDTFETGPNGGTDFYRQGLGADLFYAFSDRTGLTPFILVGAGGDHNDVYPSNRDGMSWYANAGAGFVTGPLSDRFPVKIRGEARYVFDEWNNKPKDIRFGLGLEIPLTETHRAPPAEKQAVKVVEVEKVVEVPTGLKDSDGDGVIDQDDKCPDTPPHTRVDGDGCPLGKVIELKGLHFEFNKTRIMPDGETILNWAANILKKYPDMKVEVAGHTDSIGSVKYNLKLSEGRAQAVKDFLVKAGIPETQMSVKGYGKAEPIVSNDTPEGRERNRRVELRILN
jgi:OOP family OmpA-OmpF porin